MSIFVFILLVFVMLIDVFVVVIGKGVKINCFCLSFVFKIGFLFGFIEVIILFIGWFIGCVVFLYVEVWDYWIVLIIFFGLGIYMVFESLKFVEEELMF